MSLLDIIEVDKWLIAVTITAFLIILFVLISKIQSLNEKINKTNVSTATLEGTIRERDLMISRIKMEIKGNAQDLAAVQFEEWKKSELEAHRKVIFDAAHERAKALLHEWIIDEEKGLRKDAITRSMGVNFGKITEHLLPFSSHLAEFDPRDIRFIGSPVDLMIFSGATAKKSVIDIYLVEIKTGSGQLSKKQKTIREAIENHRVYWKPIVVPEFEWDIPDDDDE